MLHFIVIGMRKKIYIYKNKTVQRVPYFSVSLSISVRDQFMCTIQRSDADIGAFVWCMWQDARIHEYHRLLRSSATEIFNMYYTNNVMCTFAKAGIKVFMPKALKNNKYCANISSLFFKTPTKIDRRKRNNKYEKK